MASLKWNDEFLNLMREEGDPVADTAAKVLWENRDNGITVGGDAEMVNVVSADLEKCKAELAAFNRGS